MPITLRQTYTSTVENLIYAASSVEFVQNLDLTPQLGVYNTLDSSFQEIDISSLNTILEKYIDLLLFYSSQCSLRLRSSLLQGPYHRFHSILSELQDIVLLSS